MIPLHDAKNRFSTLVDAAMAGRPQSVSRRGKPAVVVISAEEYERLVKASGQTSGSFLEHLARFPDGVTEFDRMDAVARDADL